MADHLNPKIVFKRIFDVLILIIFLSLSCGESLGQQVSGNQSLPAQPLTLEEAVNYGLAHNPLLGAAEEELKAAQQGVNAAKADFLPRFDTSYSYTRWKDAPIARGFPGVPGGSVQTSDVDVNRWQAELRQPLFRGGGLKAQLGVAKEERNITGYRKAETQLNLICDIRHAFIRILLAQRVVEVAGESVSQLQAHLNDAAAQYRQGLTPQNDVLKADVALANARQREASAAKELSIVRAQLNRLLGLDESMSLELSEWTRTPSEGEERVPPMQKLFDLGEKARPELASLQASIRQSEEEARLARSSAYPQLSLFGMYYREGEDFLATENDFARDNNAAVGVRMDWNWFEGGKMRANINQWRYRREALQKRLKDLLRQMRIDVKDAYEQLHVAKANLATSRVAVDQAAENYRITNIQYNQQVVISSEVLDAQFYLTQARLNYYQALYGYQTAWVDLERAVGGSFEQESK